MIRVLLVDDDQLARLACKLIVGRTTDLEVVGEAADGTEVVAATLAHRPDVVLMDLQMPHMGGIDATLEVRRLPDPPAVLAVTGFDAHDSVMRALHAGAAGFLLKSSGPDEITAAIRSVAAGEAALSPRVTRFLIDEVTAGQDESAQSAARDAFDSLSERQREIARQVVTGGTNDDIGAKLHISSSTVKTHLSEITSRLGLDNRIQLAVLVTQARLPR